MKVREEQLTKKIAKKADVEVDEIITVAICFSVVLLGVIKDYDHYIIGGFIAAFLSIVAIIWRQITRKKKLKDVLIKVKYDKDKFIDFFNNRDSFVFSELLYNSLIEYEEQYKDRTDLIKLNIMKKLLMGFKIGNLSAVPFSEMTIVDGECLKIRCYFSFDGSKSFIDITSDDCDLDVGETNEVTEQTIILNNNSINVQIPV